MSTLASGLSKTDLIFAADVREGLMRSGQKVLQASYFYDDLGTALFEAITLLPEYGLTRADTRILQNYSHEIATRFSESVVVVELGSGTGQKTRYILEALRARQAAVLYCPIDVSQAAIDRCQAELGSIAEIHSVRDSYLPGMAHAAALRHRSERLLVLFLGSTIGNFDRSHATDFLRDLRQTLLPGDSLLLGVDLVKAVDQLLPAYDDPTGVTAAFNLNLLARINRQLGANFNLRCFQHEVHYDTGHQRIEMHLRSTVTQRVVIPAAHCEVEFAAGETIWTESSHKYRLSELGDMAADSGFQIDTQWVDHEWPFVESLWTAE